MRHVITGYRLASEAIVPRFKHQVSEVFTFSDVSLSNIVIFRASYVFDNNRV